MRYALFFILLILILPLTLAEDSCDEYCADLGYGYGECRETTDDGYCEGIAEEDAYGFSSCSTDYERCCCGYEDEIEDNTTVVEGEESVVERGPVSLAESLFWFLLILVILLAVTYYSTKKKESKSIGE